MIETETKILDIDVSSVRKRLSALGAVKTFDGLIVEEHYDFPDGRIMKSGGLFRIRKFGEKAEMAFKKRMEKDGTFKSLEETEIEVSDFSLAKKIAESLGLSCVAHREKKRASFVIMGTKGRVKAEIDTYPDIPAYIEFEGGREDIRDAAKSLGLDISKAVSLVSTEVLAHYGANAKTQKFKP